jgi:hypothetical protein
MRILIAFYSRTGGTERVAQALEGEFKKRGHIVDVEKIVPKKERSAWAWHWLRLFKSDCPIQPIKIKNVDKYDLICIGSPNWTRLSLPVARYLKEIDGLRHKSVGFFSTATLSVVIEKYFLSAYLLDLTFSQLVARKEGRVVNTLLLSSLIKRWRVDSKYGQKLVKEFCDKLEIPLHSLKKYFLEKKEVEDTRFLVVLFSFVLLASLLLVRIFHFVCYRSFYLFCYPDYFNQSIIYFSGKIFGRAGLNLRSYCFDHVFVAQFGISHYPQLHFDSYPLYFFS